MPKDKDFKRLVRARIDKTGESYTTARSRLLDKKLPLPENCATLAGMSDEAVRAKTGKAWKQWVRTLDELGAISMPHSEIAALVLERYGVSGWWAQTVTVGYERIRGLREMGQRRGGGYEVNKSKTIAVPVSRLYETFEDEHLRARWLPGVEVEVRTARRDRSMRFTWPDGTPVEAGFTAKSENKSAVSIQHRKLPTKVAAEEVREFWTERLDALTTMLNDA